MSEKTCQDRLCQIGGGPEIVSPDDVDLEKLLVDPILEPFLRKAAGCQTGSSGDSE